MRVRGFAMHYDRMVVAYHGCAKGVAQQLLRGEPFVRSENDYDWLGNGVYFWEFGVDRAREFAAASLRRKKSRAKPSVVGAVLQLGRCFDLLDTRYTSLLEASYPLFEQAWSASGQPLPENEGSTPDLWLRRKDCAFINWFLGQHDEDFDTVRAAFLEGTPLYEGAGFHRETHIQIAVRNPACILGVFNPTIWESP